LERWKYLEGKLKEMNEPNFSTLKPIEDPLSFQKSAKKHDEL